MKITHNQVVENTQFTLETEEGKTDYFVIRVGVADIRGKVSQKPTPEWCYMAWLLKRAHTPDHTDAWSTTMMPMRPTGSWARVARSAHSTSKPHQRTLT
jgi:hypothetical protein